MDNQQKLLQSSLEILLTSQDLRAKRRVNHNLKVEVCRIILKGILLDKKSINYQTTEGM